MTVKTINFASGGVIVFDDETGEVFATVGKPTPKRITSVKKYIGVDVKFVDDCTNEDSLLETLSQLDAYIDTKTNTDFELLVEAVAEGMITPQQLSVFKFLSSRIIGWNVFFGTVKQICEGTGISSKHISDMLNSLSKCNLISIKYKNIPSKGCITINLNPVYTFKGDYQWREQRIKSWYK